ncbi:MAG: MerR family transcriptional regulator [Candidatus Puniceispirillaceae bacterium]
MSDKAEWAYRTISEVSDQLDVPAHVLRFWETKFTQLKPMKRSGGRRYYKATDLALLTHIRDLLYRDGYTIKGAQKFLKENKASSSTQAPSTGQMTNNPSQDALNELLDRLIALDARLGQMITKN